jgi:hypothetical protein
MLERVEQLLAERTEASGEVRHRSDTPALDS